MSGRTIVSIENLSFSYPRVIEPLLRDINLKIYEGELVIITGANGSGKTTLGKCINGLVPYSTGGVFKGRVEVCGVGTLDKDVSELALYAGFVFPNPEDQLATPQVETEIAFGLSNLGIPRETIFERVDTVLDRLAITQLRKESTFNLSTGQQQMIAIASCLVMEPRVLILDDPLSHLNQNTSDKVIEIVRELKAKGTTILWISQNMSEMFGYADRVVLLESGRIAFTGSPEAMCDEIDFGKSPVIAPQYVEFSHALVKAGFADGLVSPDLEKTVEKLKALMPPRGRASERKGDKPVGGRQGSAPLIRFDHVSFSYPNGFQALKDINLDLHEGDFVLLSGWNGSGKTTLAKHVNGLLRPTEGTVLVGGEDISGKPTSDLAREVGFLFQNPDHQLHKPTVREELLFSLKNFDVSEQEMGEKLSEVSERFGLGPLLDRAPQELSGSEKKRVTVASVLIYEPRVVVFDEATANLDRNQTRSIIEIIEKYFDETRIIISISHDIRMWADSDKLNRVVIMRDGAVVDDGAPEDILCSPETMDYLYGNLLPVTRIARSLGDRGVAPTHYRTDTLVQEISRLARSASSAAAE
ncbi:MAG: ABC transporter ATP-binding protein [Deltaproteobacteria bacterium]|nr:ABC transporter ATP-binding protein [Deltaproteobacteria bacterium]MBW2121226.1 ABC transporter ATP-binding protein [Deltaproteobacteria bacterium]